MTDTAEGIGATRIAVTPHGLRTREALLDAGRTLAREGGVDGLTVAAIVGRAGVAKGTFYVHFADRGAFVHALVDAFDRNALEAIARAVDGQAPGAKRMLLGIEAYLDACLADPVVKSLAGEQPKDRSSGLGAHFAAQLATGLRGLGWRAEASQGGHLLLALVAEAARMEQANGQRDPLLRRAIRRFVTHSDISRAQR